MEMKKCSNLWKESKKVDMPQKLKKASLKYFVAFMISKVLQNILYCALLLSKALANVNPVISIFLLMLNCSMVPLGRSINTYIWALNERFKENVDIELTNKLTNIIGKVNGKVFMKNGNFSEQLGTNSIWNGCYDYIDNVWNLAKEFGVSILLIGITVTMIAISAISMKKSEGLLVFLFLICAFNFYLGGKQVKKNEEFADKYSKCKRKYMESYNDFLNIDFGTEKELIFRKNMLLSFRDEMKEVNLERMNYRLKDTSKMAAIILLFTIVTVIVLVIKKGGISKFSVTTIGEISATIGVYAGIIQNVLNVKDSIVDLKQYSAGILANEKLYNEVAKVYMSEEKKKMVPVLEDVDCIDIDKFEFSYPSSKTLYTLVSEDKNKLKLGKSYLVSGHTGCGKTTFLHILSGKLRLGENGVIKSYGKSLYLNSVMQEASANFGSASILEELTFGEAINKEKLIEILKGVSVYYDILHNIAKSASDSDADETILKYLAVAKKSEFSSGQKQRLQVAKVLYNLQREQQLVIFDEATSQLDEKTARNVLKYICNYCYDERRVVVFTCHQVELAKEVIKDGIVFDTSNPPYSKMKFEICK